MPRYIFDVTGLRQYISRHSQISGIQRVSVTIIDRVRKRIGAKNVWLGYHDSKSNSYKLCPCPADNGCNLTNTTTLRTLLHVTPVLRSLPKMKRYEDDVVKCLFEVWHRDLRATLGHEKYFRDLGLCVDDWKAARSKASMTGKAKASHETLENVARPGDQLLLLDNAWRPKGLDPWMIHARMKLGLDVCVLLHDLIPMVTPQYTERDTRFRFRDWLLKSTQYVTHYLANSENTGRDLRAFLKEQAATQPVTVVPLAQAPLHDTDPDDTPESTYPVFSESSGMPDHIRALTKTPYVLVVGTMEVRKNLWQIATVWDRLRAQPGRDLPKLVFAGSRGWLNDDFDRLMEATGQVGGWVEIVEAPDDDVLAYLYRNCLFTITASFYEGWGLPIGESLGYGKTAVVSQSSSMPEVGGDMVEYCDPHSLDSITAACLRLIDDPENRIMLEKRIATASLRSWDMVAQEVLEAVRVS